MFFPAEIIKTKRAGRENTDDEIKFLIEGYTDGSVPDYQMSAWLMAVFFKGMSAVETATLTQAMLDSGRQLDFTSLGRLAVDKHSTGGVGDKTSMILGPIVAAAGVPVPMISGRGLGHTGGTLDKLEAIPGFRTALTLEEFRAQVADLGLAFAGQTAEICPADKKIYALRDVTATVESLPLICASIMSKKLAEGIGGLVLDVKFGTGAFMKSSAQAHELAEKLISIGKARGVRVAALLTGMDQPLGRFVGNALEIGECMAILKGESYLGRADFEDCRELSLELAAQMIWLGGKAADAAAGRKLAEEILESGRAWEKFARVAQVQGGRLGELPVANVRVDVLAESDGFVAGFDCEKIGIAAIALGAGRLRTTDLVDPTSGIEVHRKIGESVRTGEKLFTLFIGRIGDADTRAERAKQYCLRATSISLQKPHVPALIASTMLG